MTKLNDTGTCCNSVLSKLSNIIFILLFVYLPCSQASETDKEASEPYLNILPDALDNSTWSLMLDESNISVYTRPWPGSDFVAIKGVQTIHSSVSNILANFIDIAAFPEWVKDAKEGFVITPFDHTQSRKVYLRMSLPWPLQDRDIVSGQQVTQDLNTKTVKIREWYEGDALPKTEHVIRIPRLNTELLLIPIEKNVTQLIWQGHNDPGGFIPSFLVNWLIEDVFFTSMLTMKKRFESPEHHKNVNWIKNFED